MGRFAIARLQPIEPSDGNLKSRLCSLAAFLTSEPGIHANLANIQPNESGWNISSFTKLQPYFTGSIFSCQSELLSVKSAIFSNFATVLSHKSSVWRRSIKERCAKYFTNVSFVLSDVSTVVSSVSTIQPYLTYGPVSDLATVSPILREFSEVLAYVSHIVCLNPS